MAVPIFYHLSYQQVAADIFLHIGTDRRLPIKITSITFRHFLSCQHMFDSGKRKKTPGNLHFNETLTIMLQIQSESFVTWVSNSLVDFCPCNDSNIMKDEYYFQDI